MDFCKRRRMRQMMDDVSIQEFPMNVRVEKLD